METIVEKTLLFDFYGELLTPRQKEIYGEVVMNDMSLSEAANLYGVSRQGIHDSIRRTMKILEGYESKLHLLEQFETMKELVQEQKNILNTNEERGKTLSEADREKLLFLANQLLKELEI